MVSGEKRTSPGPTHSLVHLARALGVPKKFMSFLRAITMMCPTILKDRSWRISLALACLAAFHSLLWTVVMPPGTGSDEEGHFAVVEHIANKGTLPRPLKDFALTMNMRNLLDEIEHPALITDPFQKPRFIAPRDAHPRDVFDPNDYFFGSAGGPPLHYILLQPIYRLVEVRPLLVRFHAVRAFGLIFAIITAVAAHRTLLRLSDDHAFTGAVALLVVCQSMAHFIFGCVTNDGGTIAAVSMAIYMLVVKTERSETVAGAALAGALSAGLFLFKPFAVSLTIPLFLQSVVSSRGRRAKAVHAAIFIGLFALVVSPWLAWSFSEFGGPSVFSRMTPAERLGPLAIIRVHWETTSFGTLFSQAFGVFGRLCTPLPKWLRLIGAVIFFGGWCAFLINAIRGRERPAWLWLAAAPLIHAAVVFLVVYWTLHSTGYRMGLQGRYYLYPLLAWIAPMARGWFFFLPKNDRRAARLIGLLALLLALYSLGWVVFPRYYL